MIGVVGFLTCIFGGEGGKMVMVFVVSGGDGFFFMVRKDAVDCNLSEGIHPFIPKGEK